MRKLIPVFLFSIGWASPSASQVESALAQQTADPAKVQVAEIENWVKQLGSDTPATRETASKALLKIGKEALPALKAAMKSADLEQRRRAEELHNRIQESWINPKLLKDLVDPVESVRDAAMENLTKIGLAETEDLLPVYKSADAKTREKLAMVLGKVRIGAYKAKKAALADAMEKALLESLRDTNHYVIARASDALSGYEPKCKAAIPIFIEILDKKDTTQLARGAACAGLRDLGPAASAAIPTLLKCFNSNVERKLGPGVGQKAIDDSKDYVPGERASLCHVLAVVGPKDERVFATLTKAVPNRKEPENVRITAMWCIADMGERGQVIIPDLMKLLEETRENKRFSESMLRRFTVMTLVKLKLSKEQIPALIEIAGDPKEEPSTRSNAVKAVIHSRKTAQKAWRPMLKLIQGDRQSSALVEQIVIALREIDPPADADRVALARELRVVFDKILERDEYDFLAADMDETVKAVGKK